MLYLLYIFPAIILVLTTVIYYVVKNGLKSYLENLSSKVKEIESVLDLSFMRDMLTRFMSRSAARAAQMLRTNVTATATDGPVTINSGDDMDRFYASIRRVAQPSIDLERVNFIASLLQKVLLIYGYSIAVVEFALISFSFFPAYSSFYGDFDGIFLGGTIFFSVVVVLMIADLQIYSKRIKNSVNRS
ncbi:MAG: hypothetical protein M1431_09000 [Candidatus Thermoplasmatota archaeon]|nr:hypothetical protein [Candidatus Thermoplasmatota archaeon]